jgi:SAM-dependent methyltransferase
MTDPITVQRAFYKQQAEHYIHDEPGHSLALQIMRGLMSFYDCRSILDVGAGTGRVLGWLRDMQFDGTAEGVEPVPEMREQAKKRGIDVKSGDAMNLAYPDASFDTVSAFSVLHHVPHPERAIAEMLRVARRMIFISDGNNFGQGSRFSRTIKQAIDAAGLWPVANFIKTRGRGYHIAPGDGLVYSYSVFSNLKTIRASCEIVHTMNISDSPDRDMYRSASHVIVAGIKTPSRSDP